MKKNKVIDVAADIIIIAITWKVTDYFTENVWKTNVFLSELATFVVAYTCLYLLKILIISILKK